MFIENRLVPGRVLTTHLEIHVFFWRVGCVFGESWRELVFAISSPPEKGLDVELDYNYYLQRNA